MSRGEDTVAEFTGRPPWVAKYDGVEGAAKFLPMLYIKPKKVRGRAVKPTRFRPRPEQITLLRHLVNGDSVMVCKGRQIGNTTAVLLYFFWRWFTAEDPITILIVGQQEKPVKLLFRDMIKFFWRHLPKEWQRKLEVNNTTEMMLADSGARIRVDHGRSEQGLRSGNCEVMLLTEVCFVPNAGELKSQAMDLIGDGQLIMESTANHIGDILYEDWVAYHEGESDFDAALFFPWQSNPDYRTEPPPDWKPGPWLAERMEEYGIDIQQAYWYQRQLWKHNDRDRTLREHPWSFEDAYRQTGNSFLGPEETDHWEIITPEDPKAEFCILYDELIGPNGQPRPEKDDAYTIGADVSSGSGQHPSVYYVLSKKRMEPVAFYWSNRIKPTAYGKMLYEVGHIWSYRIGDTEVPARLNVESNNWGLVVLKELFDLDYPNLWEDPDKDGDYVARAWYTSHKTRLEIFEMLRDVMRLGFFGRIDRALANELLSLIDNGNKAPSVPNDPQSHGDRVMGFVLGIKALEQVELPIIHTRPRYIEEAKRRRRARARSDHFARRY